ncbi:Tigger transposable element-derived protein 6-like [Oopsacas minuta]|uniref:Tigger transposable element-derived protein 6-like n=1 Tax=Oopsacas minuta TaxID=111878 RepID=A0AAV7JLB2_9METZ|nr:Tigger transposable element-derived protein 6-like [Oopsacas minuta]
MAIIKKLKTGYKKRLLSCLIVKIDSIETGDELIKSVNVLVSIYWVAQAWQDVTQETIQKCFARSGFNFFEEFRLFETSDSTELNSIMKNFATISETVSCHTEDYVYIDSGNQVHTLESTDWEAEFHSCINDRTSY